MWNGDCKSWKTELSYNGESFQEIELPHDIYHMIGPGSILKYDNGKYSVLEGENIFDLYKLPENAEYCQTEDLYYTPKGKLTKAQLDYLNNMNEEKPEEKGFFQKIYDKFQEFKEKIISWWKN